MKNFSRLVAWTKTQYRLLTDKKYTTIAGTLVYFFIMSVVPFSFWLTLLLGKWIDLKVETLFDFELFAAFEEILLFLRDNAGTATKGASLVLLATTLYSSTNLFYHMRRSGEFLYGYEESKRGWKLRLSALVLLFIMFLFLGAFILFLVSGYYLLCTFFNHTAGRVFSYLFLTATALLLSFLLNLYVCPYRIDSKKFLGGSVLTTMLWSLALVGFTIYLRIADFSRLYGAVSTIVVFLLWLYIMMNCFVIGVVYNSECIKHSQKTLKKF